MQATLDILTRFWPAAALVGEFLLKLVVIAIIVVRQRGRPQSILAWSVVVLAVPLLGIIAYLMVGEVRLGRRRIERHREVVRLVHDPVHQLSAGRPEHEPLIPQAFRHIAPLASAVGDCIPRAGNTLQLLSDTDLFVQTLVEDIEAAQSHCHLLYYIVLPDNSGARVAEALRNAARRGVVCRLLVDAVGSRDFLDSALCRSVRDSGVQVVAALPANALRMLLHRIDLRNHRKIAVIDGAIGYMGSHNLGDAEFVIKKKYAPWVDTTVRAEGPIARDLQLLFVQDWYLDTNTSLVDVLAVEPTTSGQDITAQIVGTGPAAYIEALQQLLLASIHTSREELIITTPYFVPSEATAAALRTAARRGIDVHIIVPARNDSPFVAAASRSQYGSLLDAGVRIFEYNRGLLHAKTVTVDRDLAIVTTANFDRRSFELNFEVSMVVYDTDFASQLRFLQRSYEADATQVDPGQWARRGWPSRLWQNAAGVLGPLL